MGPEPAKEKKRNGGVKRGLLWKPKTNTDWVAVQRFRFLDKAMEFPGAKEKLDRLLDAEILELARQDFEEDPTNGTASIAIVNAIETWAIDAGLARKPVEDYWIFEMAINRLRDLVHGPETAVFCRTGLAEATLDSLLDSETLELAQRDFGGKPNGPASMALKNKFETWAVSTTPVRKPVDDHWICDPLMNMLRELVRAPKNAISIRDKMAKVIQDNLPDSDSSLILGNWSGEWSTTCDLSLKQVRKIPSFTCGEWDPCAESEVDYRETVNNALEEYLKDVRVRYDEAGFMPGVTRRDDKHFEWLVRHDMLGESYEDIANTPSYATIEAHVQTATSQLRNYSHHDSFIDPDPFGDPVLYVYRTVRNPKVPGGAEFVPELIHNNSGVGSSVTVADLNGDGAPEILTSTKTGSFIFWNRGKAKPAAK